LKFCFRTSKSISLDSKFEPEWWTQFPEEVKQKLEPCRTSLYAPYETLVINTVECPLFQKDLPLTDWVKRWSRLLIPQALATKKERGLLFNYCRGLMDNLDVSLYILPYLLIHVGKYGTNENRDMIRDEILHVLKYSDKNSAHAQTIFSLIETLGKWVENTKKEKEISSTEIEEYKRIQILLSKIPKGIPMTSFILDDLARSALQNKAYNRAFMYYELYLREQNTMTTCSLQLTQNKQNKFQNEHITELHRIYSYLGEKDGMKGIATLRRYTSLKEELIDYQCLGNWSNALKCCEICLEEDPESISFNLDALESMLNLGHLQMMINKIDGILPRLKTEGMEEIKTYGVQAAWRLGRWETVEKYIDGAKDEFEIGLAKSFLFFREKKKVEFLNEIQNTRKKIMQPLSAASMESYHRSYPLLIKLKILRELEKSFEYFEKNPKTFRLDITFKKNWENSLQITENSLKVREPILAVRQTILNIQNMSKESDDVWLQLAKLARKTGYHQNSSSFLLKIKNVTPDFIVQKGKLLWEEGQNAKAISIIENSLEKINHEDPKRAKLMLMMANWNIQTYQIPYEEIDSMFNNIIEMRDKWEKGYYSLAKCIDSMKKISSKELKELLTNYGKKANDIVDSYLKWIPKMIQYYGKSLRYGHSHVYESLPRTLTHWFDNSDSLEKNCLSQKKKTKLTKQPMTEILQSMNDEIREILREIPKYMWLTVLPQLVSRICHQNQLVLELLNEILVLIAQTYPKQVIWSFASIYFSTVQERKQNALDLIKNIKTNSDSEISTLIDNNFNLFSSLIELCNWTPKKRGVDVDLMKLDVMKKIQPKLPLSSVIVPLQSQLTVSLPPKSEKDQEEDKSYNPFNYEMITVQNFKQELTILASLQKPKKIGIIGSDKKTYFFLCKPKDDLRKDNRMMEFGSMINRLLKLDTEARKKKLYLRLYSVLPLNEDTGIIEWVNNTETYRKLCDEQYTDLGLYKSTTDLKNFIEKKQSKSKNKLSLTDIMKNDLFEMFPPVFYRWFLKSFPEPALWFQSKLNYARTVAVTSIVGYIVGLGDRHGENSLNNFFNTQVLFDKNTGECVQIDFSMLFEKGKTLAVKEMVPFRFTQNMVDACGITGYEGVFREVCHNTMSVLRDNKDTLMNVLETFVHDPLVEWDRDNNGKTKIEEVMGKIEKKLQGFVESDDGYQNNQSDISMSVAGQVQKLINSATNIENLGKMYTWWMPWL
jgi:serine/threonine-protein kinase ATR